MRLSKKGVMLFTAACVAGIIGCGSDSTSNAPRVAVASSLAPGATSATQNCQLANADWPQIGDPANTTFADGDPVNGSKLSVICTVKTSADGFAVDGRAEISGQSSFHVFGDFTPSGQQKNLSAEWNQVNAGKFAQNGGCTADYPTGVNPPVTLGRVWATITCPIAALDAARACQGTATFRFENCTQQ